MIGNLLLALLFIFIRISFFLGGWGTELLRTKNFAGRNRVHLYCSTSCGAGSYDIGGKRRFWAWLLHNFLEKKKKKTTKMVGIGTNIILFRFENTRVFLFSDAQAMGTTF